jgi:hypothetical protein
MNDSNPRAPYELADPLALGSLDHETSNERSDRAPARRQEELQTADPACSGRIRDAMDAFLLASEVLAQLGAVAISGDEVNVGPSGAQALEVVNPARRIGPEAKRRVFYDERNDRQGFHGTKNSAGEPTRPISLGP